MAALVAGDCAGGDHRGRLAAGIRVAKRGVDGYWFELYTDQSKDAVVDLLRKYAELKREAKGDWRGGQLPFSTLARTAQRASTERERRGGGIRLLTALAALEFTL